jgi:hypothetical protein
MPRFAHLAEEAVGLLGCSSPGVRVLQEPGVFLEDHAGVVAPNLLRDDVGDVLAAPPRSRDRIHEGERLLGDRDVRADATHGVQPRVSKAAHNVAHEMRQREVGERAWASAVR